MQNMAFLKSSQLCRIVLALSAAALFLLLDIPCTEAHPTAPELITSRERSLVAVNPASQRRYWRHNWFQFNPSLNRWKIIPTPRDSQDYLSRTENQFNLRMGKAPVYRRSRQPRRAPPPQKKYRTPSPPPRPYTAPRKSPPPQKRPPPAKYPSRPTPVVSPTPHLSGGGGGGSRPSTGSKSLANAEVDYCGNHILVARNGEYYGGPAAVCYCAAPIPNIIGAKLTIRMDQSCGGRFRSPVRYESGVFSAYIKTAAGYQSGIVTSFYLSSLEGSSGQMEIDFEWLGKDMTKVQLNYYVNGKGGHETFPALGFDSRADYHKYAIDYQSGVHIKWFIDDRLVREEYKTGSNPFPTGPMYLYASVWDGSPVLGGGWSGPITYANQPYHVQYRDIRVPA